VGPTLGDVVLGDVEGDTVGTPLLGDPVGVLVGDAVVGDVVGDVVGGADVGDCVGDDAVGATDGDCVGVENVGNKLGSNVGSAVGDKERSCGNTRLTHGANPSLHVLLTMAVNIDAVRPQLCASSVAVSKSVISNSPYPCTRSVDDTANPTRSSFSTYIEMLPFCVNGPKSADSWIA
jgi:hypothetical protein